MTYTVSHRQAGVQRANVAGLIRHEYRDVDKANGVETQHSNERIVPARTLHNFSQIYIDGVGQAMSSSQEIIDELDRRLATAGGTRTNKKTGKTERIGLRKDAAVVRNIVLQLDPKFTRSAAYLLDPSCPPEHMDEVMRLQEEMIAHYSDLYGAENLLASSFHLDETSPHVHLMVTPIDDEGRVRNASFIADGKGPKGGMARNDRAMRQRLSDADYDVDMTPRGMNRSHLSVDDYAKFMEREEMLAAREVEVEDLEQKAAGALQSAQEARERAEATVEAANGVVAAYNAAEAAISSERLAYAEARHEIGLVRIAANPRAAAADQATKAANVQRIQASETARAKFLRLTAPLPETTEPGHESEGRDSL